MPNHAYKHLVDPCAMAGDDQLPMLNHWQEQEQEEEIDEKPKDEGEAVFIGGEMESANIG